MIQASKQSTVLFNTVCFFALVFSLFWYLFGHVQSESTAFWVMKFFSSAPYLFSTIFAGIVLIKERRSCESDDDKDEEKITNVAGLDSSWKSYWLAIILCIILVASLIALTFLVWRIHSCDPWQIAASSFGYSSCFWLYFTLRDEEITDVSDMVPEE